MSSLLFISMMHGQTNIKFGFIWFTKGFVTTAMNNKRIEEANN
jgi:hypothetical protein